MASQGTRNPFTIDNLPYGVISTQKNPARRCATAYGGHAVDLSVLYRADVFKDIPELIVNVFATVRE